MTTEDQAAAYLTPGDGWIVRLVGTLHTQDGVVSEAVIGPFESGRHAAQWVEAVASRMGPFSHAPSIQPFFGGAGVRSASTNGAPDDARSEATECPRCEGKGFTLVNDGDDHYDEVECGQCGGRGVVSQ